MIEQGLDEKSRAVGPSFLNHSLAFGEQSGQVFNGIVEEIRMLSSQGYLYPPEPILSLSHPEPESSITLVSQSDLGGRLTPAEAAAMKMLLTESTALAQSYVLSDWETSSKILQVLQLPKNGWQGDAIEALGDFGMRLGMAAGVRDRVLSGKGRPDTKTHSSFNQRPWWDEFVDPIRLDQLILGRNTADAIVKSVSHMSEKMISNNPEGARTQEEIQARIASRKHGVILASDLYLEALGRASALGLSTKLERSGRSVLSEEKR